MVDKATARTAVVNYQSPIAERCRNLAVASTACFIVFFPLPIFFWLLLPMRHSIVEACLFAASLFSLVFFLTAFNAYRLNRSGRMVLTDAGFVLPAGKLVFGSATQAISWSNIEKIAVVNDGFRKRENASLLLSVKGRKPVRLRLSSLSSEDLDKLVSACELWANRWTRDNSFIELVETVTNKRAGSDDSSFTALWLQEAHRRLSTTPFVPLEPDAILQDGRVKVVQTLTAGGWSAIYLCQWQDKTPAVLKEAVVPPGVGEELKKKAYEHFERESVLLSGLDHPQIARVIDYFVENSRQYMVLQRISGANLRTYIKDRGPVSERQALKWTRELVEIVAYLHGRDPPIVHRDVTPENLVLDMRGSLVLIDFGSANEFVGTVTGTLVGKPSYVAPEQFSGRANLQSDLYSLGAVIHFMLTGEDPEPLTVASPRCANPLVSDALDSLVSDLMRLNLKERLPNIDQVKARLLQILPAS